MAIRVFICLLLVAAPLVAADLEKLQRELAAKRAALAVDDVEGRHKLARWCKSKKMRQSELRLYSEILRLAPEDADAHEQLGHVKDGETWHETVEAMQLSKGRVRYLSEWADPIEGEWELVHEYRLSAEQAAKLEKGDVLKAHSGDDWHEVISREFVITSRLKVRESLELARVLEQAVRIWREDAGLEFDPVKAITLKVEILKNNKAFVDMIESDIESFSDDMKKSQGFFDGQRCWLSYFHDWYRTRRVLLHEARHQFDMLVAQNLFNMPAWYKEGTAEYWSMHEWDGKTLKLGQLVPDVNYSLYFCGKLLRKRKIKGVEKTFEQGWWGEVDPEFYQNSWAFVYYLRHSDHADGFKKFESELKAGQLRDGGAQLSAFKKHVTEDFKTFDKGYLEQLEEWSELSPRKMR